MGEPALQLLDGLQETAPVLHRLADARDVQGLGFEDEGAHEGGGIEDRLERHRVGECTQEVARLGARRALAHQRQDVGGETLAR